MHKKINISTYVAPLTRLGSPELVVKTLKGAGFDSFDFTMMFPILGFELFYNSIDYISKAEAFKRYTDELKIYCNQTHGAVPCFKKNATSEENNILFENVKRTIKITHILGAKYCVLHPVSDCSMEENICFFNRLKDFAIENDVVIAIENTLSDKLFGKPEDFVRLLSELNNEHFKMCLDIGHAETKNAGSSAIEFIDSLKNQIVCLHIHDNDKEKDLHQLPFTYLVKFNDIFHALKKHNYQGDITFECGAFFDNMPTSLFFDALKFLHKIGEYIATQIYK